MKNTNYTKFHLIIAILILFKVPAISSNTETDLFDLVVQRIQQNQWEQNENTVLESDVDSYLELLQTSGAFSDINYSDNSQTGWTPVGHLNRVKSMALAYTKQGNKYYESITLHTHITNALEYWHTADPRSSNWYNQQIGCPQRMGLILIILRAGKLPLSATLENKLLARMTSIGGRPDQSGSQGTGANKVDIATHWVYRACLEKNKANLSFAMNQVYMPLEFTSGEGFQHDYSYLQHGQQLYIGGYGNVIATAVANIAVYMKDTEYAIKGENLSVLSSYLTKTFLPTIRGQHANFNVGGRSLSRPNALYQGGFASVLKTLKQVDTNNDEDYDSAMKRLTKSENSSYGLKPFNTVYWRADYALHQRPGYTMDVRMVSNRTLRNENGNGENIKGYFLTDGAYDIAIEGDEYVDIFPVWDWTKIPGTTVPSRQNIVNASTGIPQPAQWGTAGSALFAGGVSDGTYGAVGYDNTDNNYSINTSAKKSWFFFDDEIVCLGAGIKSTAPENILTTLNQCLSKDDVIIASEGNEPVLFTEEINNFTDVNWILHNKIAYLFPKKNNVTVSNKDQTGTWKSINTSASSEEVTKKVFSAWIDHGTQPKDSGYEYIILPNKTADEVKMYSADRVTVLSNTDSMQVVKHNVLNTYSIIFYKPAIFSDGEITIQSLQACAVIVKNAKEKEVTLHISDPSQSSSIVRLITEFPQIEGAKGVECPIPAHPYSGSTQVVTVNNTTADYVPIEKDYIAVVRDTHVNGSSKETNFSTANDLFVQYSPYSTYVRRAYLDFDLSTVDLLGYNRIYLRLAVKSIQQGKSGNPTVEVRTVPESFKPTETMTFASNGETITAQGVKVSENCVFPKISPEGSTILIDITDYVKSNTDKTPLRLQVSGVGSYDGNIYFYSSEGALDANKTNFIPTLVLEKINKSVTVIKDEQINVQFPSKASPYAVVYGKEFELKFTVESGYYLKDVKINDISVAEGQLTESNGIYTLNIASVTEDLTIHITADTKSSINIVQSQNLVYSDEQTLIIKALSNINVEVYSIGGILIFKDTVYGTKKVALKKGIYLIKLADKTYKVTL